jgi:hypothetical protein
VEKTRKKPLTCGEAVAVTQMFRWQEDEIRPVSLKTYTEEFHVL